MNNKKGKKKSRHKRIAAAACLFLFLTGCSSQPAETTNGLHWQEDWIQIGNFMGIEESDKLTLQDNKETLAADGLYFATWVTGDSVPYKNGDGKTIDLYDAQLYLLASETTDKESATKNHQTWLASAEENYDVQTKENITCNGQSYTLITYDCTGKDTPYERGVSALGVCGAHAVCAELTCVKDYDEDLTKLLTDFLNGCHFSKQE